MESSTLTLGTTLVQGMHIAVASYTLLAFWILAALPKGSPTHVRIGRSFTVGMYGVAVSGALLTLWTLLHRSELRPGQTLQEVLEASLFLNYLGIASATTAANGVWRIRARNNPALLTRRIPRMANAITLACGIASAIYGATRGSILFLVMSLVGISIGGGYLASLRRGFSSWKTEHFVAMVGGGVALHTGLIAGGGLRFMPESWQALADVTTSNAAILFWMMPAVLGNLLIASWRRIHR